MRSSLIFAAIVCPFSASVPAAAAKPNIVFILADDLGYGDPGCYNARSDIPTPNIDRLAREGMRFTDAHSPSAVCTPTRYGVMTGRYCWRSKLKSGVLWGFSPALIEPKRTTVASLLKQNGYRTGGVGKWHLGLGTADKTDYSKRLKPSPLDYGFDSYFGIPASLDMEPYVYLTGDTIEKQPTEKIAFRRNPRGVFWRGGPIAPGFKHVDVLPRCAEKAVEFIEAEAKRDEPFFLYMPLSAPHTPWVPTKPFAGKSKAGLYGDFTVQVDWTVGRVLKALDETGQTKNTLLIFTSDNGAHWTPDDKRKFAHRANLPWRGQKADIWEGGHRVPYLVRWPGQVRPGSTSDETICHTDLLATCAEVVGAKLPQDAGEDSYSLVSVLKGQRREGALREATVHHSARGVFAIRQGKWKLILGRGSGGFSNPKVIKPKAGEPQGQLYDLAADPSEKQNLYQKHPQVVVKLTALLNRYKTSGRSR